MDDIVAKPPVKPGRRVVRTADTAAVASPTRLKVKPTGRKPASAAKPAPLALPPEPIVPAALAATPASAAPLAAAPAPVDSTAAKDTIMTDETIETVTADTRTAFTEASDRAKGAVEKTQKLLEDANEFGKGNIEALVESSKIAVRGLETLGQDAAAYAKKSFEEAATVAKTLTSVKSPTEFFKLHSDYVRSSFDALVQHSSHNAEAVLKLAGEVVQPLSNRVALAAEKLKVAA